MAPEVSTLDFANGVTLSGFEVPSILVRRASTEVELREGQYLALAGLIDNSTLENVSKIPILGDIPILGQFFRSTQTRARQTELAGAGHAAPGPGEQHADRGPDRRAAHVEMARLDAPGTRESQPLAVGRQPDGV